MCSAAKWYARKNWISADTRLCSGFILLIALTAALAFCLLAPLAASAPVPIVPWCHLAGQEPGVSNLPTLHLMVSAFLSGAAWISSLIFHHPSPNTRNRVGASIA
jgi:hypothetical protein